MILQSFEMQALLVEIGLMITIIEAKAEILSFFKSLKKCTIYCSCFINQSTIQVNLLNTQ